MPMRCRDERDRRTRPSHGTSLTSDLMFSRSSRSVPLARLAPHAGGKRLCDAERRLARCSVGRRIRRPGIRIRSSRTHNSLGRSTRSTTEDRRACRTLPPDAVSPSRRERAGLEGAALSDEGAEEGVFAAQSDAVEVADDDAVGLPERGAGVGHALGGAVRGNERLRST
jgi:hypothetical protein